MQPSPPSGAGCFGVLDFCQVTPYETAEGVEMEEEERARARDEHNTQGLQEVEGGAGTNALTLTGPERTFDDADAGGVEISRVALDEERSIQTQDLSGAADEKAPLNADEQLRERIMNDMVNCGTIAALIGGFGLSLFDREFGLDSFEFAMGVLTFLSVHLCTFSAVASAIIYRRLNCMDGEEASRFAKTWTFVCKLPHGVFVVGCYCYLVSVVCIGVSNNGGPDGQVSYRLAYGICGGVCCGAVACILAFVH